MTSVDKFRIILEVNSYMQTLRPINIKQGKRTNPNISFFSEKKKSCSGGIPTHDTLLARQML